MNLSFPTKNMLRCTNFEKYLRGGGRIYSRRAKKDKMHELLGKENTQCIHILFHSLGDSYTHTKNNTQGGEKRRMRKKRKRS